MSKLAFLPAARGKRIYRFDLIRSTKSPAYKRFLGSRLLGIKARPSRWNLKRSSSFAFLLLLGWIAWELRQNCGELSELARFRAGDVGEGNHRSASVFVIGGGGILSMISNRFGL